MKQKQNPLLELIPSAFPNALNHNGSIVLNLFIPAVDGEVVAKERPQAKVITGKTGKPFPSFYTPKKTAMWEKHVAETARTQAITVDVVGDDFILPFENVRVMAQIRFNLRKPPSYPKSVVHATKKPDLDNLVKAILDGLVLGRVLGDDNCVVALNTSKHYADIDHPPGVEIELTCLPI